MYEGEKKLETQAQMYEEKIIELHSVIAELTKQRRKQGTNPALAHFQGQVNIMLYIKVFIVAST